MRFDRKTFRTFCQSNIMPFSDCTEIALLFLLSQFLRNCREMIFMYETRVQCDILYGKVRQLVHIVNSLQVEKETVMTIDVPTTTYLKSQLLDLDALMKVKCCVCLTVPDITNVDVLNKCFHRVCNPCVQQLVASAGGGDTFSCPICRCVQASRFFPGKISPPFIEQQPPSSNLSYIHSPE